MISAGGMDLCKIQPEHIKVIRIIDSPLIELLFCHDQFNFLGRFMAQENLARVHPRDISEEHQVICSLQVVDKVDITLVLDWYVVSFGWFKHVEIINWKIHFFFFYLCKRCNLNSFVRFQIKHQSSLRDSTFCCFLFHISDSCNEGNEGI